MKPTKVEKSEGYEAIIIVATYGTFQYRNRCAGD